MRSVLTTLLLLVIDTAVSIACAAEQVDRPSAGVGPTSQRFSVLASIGLVATGRHASLPTNLSRAFSFFPLSPLMCAFSSWTAGSRGRSRRRARRLLSS